MATIAGNAVDASRNSAFNDGSWSISDFICVGSSKRMPSPKAPLLQTLTLHTSPWSSMLPAKQGTARRRGRFLGGDHARTIFFEVISDRLDADLHGTCGLGGIKILKREEKRSRLLDDLLHWRVCGLIHPALVARQAHHTSDPGHPSGELRSPQDFVRVGAVRGRPHIGDVERRIDSSGVKICAEHPLENIGICRQVLRP